MEDLAAKRARGREYYQRNKERIAAKYQYHRAEIRAKQNAAREANAEKHRDRDRKRYARRLELSRPYRKKYYAENKAKILASAKEWRATRRLTREPPTEAARAKWRAEATRRRQKDPGRFRELCSRRRATQYRTDINPKMTMWFYRRVHDADIVFCYYCQLPVPKKRRQVDHVIPIMRGGPHEIGNLAASCVSCNCWKNDWLLSEWIRPGQQLLAL